MLFPIDRFEFLQVHPGASMLPWPGQYQNPTARLLHSENPIGGKIIVQADDDFIRHLLVLPDYGRSLAAAS